MKKSTRTIKRLATRRQVHHRRSPWVTALPEDYWVRREADRVWRELHDTLEEKRDHVAPLDRLVDEYK